MDTWAYRSFLLQRTSPLGGLENSLSGTLIATRDAHLARLGVPSG